MPSLNFFLHDKDVRSQTNPCKDFHKIDSKNSTLLDVREPSESIVRPVSGAILIPFFELSKKIDSIPKDRPVYVFCSTGDRSEEVAEILADRDYDVYDVEGGLDAVPKAHFVDAKGQKCPGPIVQVDEAVKRALVGDEIQVEADEKAFSRILKFGADVPETN